MNGKSKGVLYKSFYEAARAIPQGKDREEFMFALMEYQFTGETPEFTSDIARLMFIQAKYNIDADTKRKDGGRSSKIDEDTRSEISERFEDGEKPEDLAKDYNCGIATIYRIIKNWQSRNTDNCDYQNSETDNDNDNDNVGDGKNYHYHYHDKTDNDNGFIDKKIIKNNDNENENENDNENENENENEKRGGVINPPLAPPLKKSASKHFVPPSVEAVREYCRERNNGVSAEQFVNFYTSKGWFVGSSKMRDWRAAVRTWEQRNKSGGDYKNPNQGTRAAL